MGEGSLHQAAPRCGQRGGRRCTCFGRTWTRRAHRGASARGPCRASLRGDCKNRMLRARIACRRQRGLERRRSRELLTSASVAPKGSLPRKSSLSREFSSGRTDSGKAGQGALARWKTGGGGVATTSKTGGSGGGVTVAGKEQRDSLDQALHHRW